MRINSIRLTNYRCHADLKVDFQPGFNVIVGVNGSGKTSLLRALCDVLAGYSRFLSLTRGNYAAFADPSVVRLEVVVTNGRYRFEPQSPTRVTAVGEIFGTPCTWGIQKLTMVPEPFGDEPGRTWMAADRLLKGDGGERVEQTLPIAVFYRANRHWNQAPPGELQAATARDSRTDGLVNWADASLDSTALQSWVIARCLERFQASSESGAPFDSIDDDELALVNSAIADAVEDAKGLKYDLKQKSLLIEWMTPGRQPTAFENLSDGQKAVIGLVADIARRMCLLNPQLGQDVTRKTPGVVLIDELDIHLHPRWQRILTSGLKRAFPSVQFIVASHSPQVLGELQPEEIILLRPEGTGHPQVSYGLTSNQILEEIMDAEARTPEVEKLVNQLFEKLERNQLADARADLKTLEATAPEIPELAGAQALLRRKELLGR